MIEFQKIIKIYSYQLQDIFCCDCIFDKVTTLLFSSEEFTTCDEFINVIEEEFVKDKFVNLAFSGAFLLVCKPTIKFILENKEIGERLMKRSCITDLIELENEKIRICTVCFLQIIERNNLLKKFKLEEKLRNDYFFL